MLDFCWRGSVSGEDKILDYPLPGKLAEGCYDQGKLIPAVEIQPASGWKAVANWTPSDHTGTRPDFTNVPMLVAESPSGVLKFAFEGDAVGIAVAAGADAGILEYSLDSQPWQRQDLFTSWSAQLHLPWFYTLAYRLKPGKHLLRLKLSADRNPFSKGTACRIRYFYVNR